MQFAVRYVDAARRVVVQETVEAASEAALRAQWLARGHALLEVRGVRAAAPAARAAASASAGAINVAWWCRELRTLLHAGMTAVEALETLHAQSLGTPREAVHAQLLQALRAGQSLSRALQGTDVFPAVLVASIKASERTSTLVAALDDFQRYHQLLEGLRKKAVSAAIYPAVVGALGAVIALFLLAYVMPRFARMYGDLQGSASGATRVLLALSQALTQHGPLLAALGAALLALVAWAARRGLLLAWLERLAGAIAPLQRQWDQFRLAKLYQSLAVMFRGGYTLDEALQVCASLGLGGRLSAGLRQAQQALERGRPVSAAFAEAGLTDTVSHRLLAVGERTGEFDQVLQTIADRHAENFSTFIERATRIVEPLLLLLVALVVGGIVVLMYMPVFDLANGLRE